MSENKHTTWPWRRITAPGQVKVGDRIRFNIGDDKFDAVAKEILFPCSEREEIIYNKTRNYYLITSMCMANKGSQKNVEFLSVETIESATKQRDELLAALEAIEPWIQKTSAKEGGASAFSAHVRAADMVRDAIASVKGEQ